MNNNISFTLKLLLQSNLKDNKIRLDFENENIYSYDTEVDSFSIIYRERGNA